MGYHGLNGVLEKRQEMNTSLCVSKPGSLRVYKKAKKCVAS